MQITTTGKLVAANMSRSTSVVAGGTTIQQMIQPAVCAWVHICPVQVRSRVPRSAISTAQRTFRGNSGSALQPM